MGAALLLLLLLVAPAAAAPPLVAGATLSLASCDATSPAQAFAVTAAAVQTPDGALCATYGGSTSAALTLQPCAGSAAQAWAFSAATGAFSGTPGDHQCVVWNVQGGDGSEGVGDVVSVWPDCPAGGGFNEVFSVNTPAPGLIALRASSPGNATFSGLCVAGVNPPPPVPPPVGTPEQVAWQGQGAGTGDMAVFIHYNMATADGSQGCGCSGAAPPNTAKWAPTALDTDAWIAAGVAMGATRFVLVAKHGCGYLTWNSSTAAAYGYSIADSGYPSVDVVARFVASAKAAGVGYGFYYSVVSNLYLNVCNGVVQPGAGAGQRAVSQAQYDGIVLGHLSELWGNYGSLVEAWLDGGYSKTLQANLTALLAKLQPHMVAFGGSGLLASAVRWVGTESGHAPYPCWSTASPSDNGAGSADGIAFIPAETDFTLQNSDQWFYNAAAGVHPPAELRAMWEGSVGHNTPVIIDLAPKPDGSLPPEQVAAAHTLGAFNAGCYGAPPLGSVGGSGAAASPLVLELGGAGGAGVALDRVELREDLLRTRQQLVRGFTLTAQLADGSSVDLLARAGAPPGSSIGARFILVLPAPLAGVVSVRLNVTATAALAPAGAPFIAALAARSCDALARSLDAAWADAAWPAPAAGWQPAQAYTREWAPALAPRRR